MDLTTPVLSTQQLEELIGLLPAVDSAELKLTVPDTGFRATVAALDMDPLQAQLRQVVFFDTPDLALDRRGVVLRGRRIQDKAGDVVVKLRPVQPEALSPWLRQSPKFSVEVDALPGGFTCSGSMKAKVDDADLRAVMLGTRPVSTLLRRTQRRLYAEQVGDDGPGLDDLSVLGPIHVLKLKWKPPDLSRRMVAELWLYPDGGRILELSTKCEPAEAFAAAKELRAFLAFHAVALSHEQQTKTRSALEFFAGELAGG